ncbi:hypothetical protein MTP99_006660 [Tenebrio molitor]|jgi:hypothetical protein|uniref:peptidoglycan-recognition protein LB-like n=1 Tax=Tenebrio molitor TaxID=7067 RepID=UPI0026F72A1B|nr:hypothetical protein MTP99_006660 [Tenebrio molitor]
MYPQLLFAALIVVGAVSGLDIISRDGWNARPPTNSEAMSNPVPYVVIHHSAEPAACYTKDDCIAAMQTMQHMHQDTNGWADIGYSFGVGGDGNAYEGRGWSKVGAHAPGYNAMSIGICVIGNWMEELPPKNQLDTVHELIQYGVELGMISEDYQLVGHREVKETLCPGDQLYAEITTWDHFVDL